MDEAGIRRQRLLSLLPRVLAEQPRGGAVAGLVEAMASGLGALDLEMRRVMRDHWLERACCESGGDAPALERLGALLGLPRKPWEEEDCGAYRHRIRQTARVLSSGLTTPRAILALALAALGSELCPRLQRDGDTVRGIGLPLGTLARCRDCRGRPGKGTCPHWRNRLLEATVTDNPVTIRRQRVAAVTPGGSFPVDNGSLVNDRPEIILQGHPQQAVDYPAVKNRATQESVLFAGRLPPGARLRLQPQLSAAELAPFGSGDPAPHHPWRTLYPQGRATLTDADGREQDVRDRIHYLSGYVFAGDGDHEGTRFGGPEAGEPRFGTLANRVRSPRLRPGQDQWEYKVFTKAEMSGAVGVDDALVTGAPESAGEVPLQLTLAWWTRPRTCFRLRIPKSDWVHRAEQKGALEFVRDTVEWARAAGVTALTDFPEPVQREDHALDARFAVAVRDGRRERQSPEARDPQFTSGATLAEDAAPGAGQFSVEGIFDVTRLDWSHGA